VLLAQQGPMAGDLRLVVSATELERIADRATNITKRTVYTVTGELPQMDASYYEDAHF
jgi:phosphate uptake regulator